MLKTHLTQRYGAKFLPDDMTIQDFGVTYDELEPHYDRFEYLCGTSGQAGNLKGQILEGGNPFEGPRSRPYPTPPQDQPFSSGKRATGVTFVDTSGEEWKQPADLVILAAFSIFNVQLLLMSGVGKPYDPVANQGVIGRNFTHQTISSVNGFFDKDKFNFNPFIASGSIGMCIDEFNGDNSTMGPWVSSAADTWDRCRPTGARFRQTTFRPARRPGAPNGKARCATII